MSSRIRTENRRVSLAQRLALAPYSVWAVIFVAVPLVFVAYYAFTDESFRFTTENLTKFFTAVSTITDDSGATREVHTYLLIFWRSVKLAVISTAICLLMGYPIAYIIARAAPRTQKTIITLIMIPMWMNFLIRTYAWMTILQDTGLLNMLFSALHLGQAHIIGTEGAVVVGMVYDYFPSISTFYISQKLGNGKFFLIGDAIEGQYVANNLHFAAAIAFILMLILLAAMALMKRGTNKRVYGGV